MKKIILSVFAITSIFATVHAQSFEVTSKTNFMIDVKVDSNDLYKDFKVGLVFQNTSTNSANSNFVWEATIVTPLPDKWLLTLCDPSSCNVIKQTPTSSFSVAANSSKVSILDVGAITEGMPGSVTVKVKIYPQGKPESSKTFNYKINVESPTGVELDEALLSTYALYPNPCTNTINIPAAISDRGAQVNVFNMMGNKVKDFGKVDGNGSLQSLDISELPAGAYNLMITTSTGKNFNRLFTKN